MEKSTKSLKNEKQNNKFNDTDKRLLIRAVKNQKHIWDKCHKLHSNRNAMRAAWREIGKEIGKTDEACKQNWRSILDSKRYYNQKRKASKKSGSGCDLEFLSDDSQDPWEFSEDLEFLTEASELRSTSCSQVFNTIDFESTQDSVNDLEMLPTTSSESKKPNYSYKNSTVSPKNVYLNEMRAGVSKVAEVMTTLVDVAKKQNEINANTPFLNYVDSLLLKLPKDVVQDVQSKIIAMLHEEVSVQRYVVQQ